MVVIYSVSVYSYGMDLNRELINQFATEVEEGLPLMYTCDLLEIAWQTFDNWMKQGEADKQNKVRSLYCEFFTAIKKAYARFVKDSRNKIRTGEKGWQGVAWWLERTNKTFVLTNESGDVVEPVIVKSSVNKNKGNK